MEKRRRIRLVTAQPPPVWAPLAVTNAVEVRPTVPGHTVLPPGDAGLPQPPAPLRRRIVVQVNS